MHKQEQERLSEKARAAFKATIIGSFTRLRDWRDELRDRDQNRSEIKILSLANQALSLFQRQISLTKKEVNCVELDELDSSSSSMEGEDDCVRSLSEVDEISTQELEIFFRTCADESSSSSSSSSLIRLPLPSDDDGSSSFFGVQLPLPSDILESSHCSRARFTLPTPVCTFRIQLPHVA